MLTKCPTTTWNNLQSTIESTFTIISDRFVIFNTNALLYIDLWLACENERMYEQSDLKCLKQWNRT